VTDGPADRPADGEPIGSVAGREESARRALRWDAAYCTVAGVIIAAFATSIEHGLEVSAWIVAATGVGAVMWAGVLAGLARHDRWRRSTAVAAAANGAGALAIAVWAVANGGTAGLLLGLLAAQLAAFGVIQAWMLLEA